MQVGKSVFFLFINGPHHVYHLIEPALRFATDNNQYEPIFVSGNPINTKIIKDSQRLYSSASFKLIDIPLPLRYRLIKSYKAKLYPPVNTRLNKIVSKLKNASAIVSTSHELPKYINKNKIKRPKLFYLYHGTGTREYGFDNKLDGFDYILAPGPYHRDRLINDDVCDEKKIRMVGQPKLEWIKNNHPSKTNLFNNENPVFYYNPHWEMEISSYLSWRNVVLDFFRKHKEYNLIFAPHPLVKHHSKRKNYKINNQDDSSENIIIDLDSPKLNDGTYNALSDVYIGDVSSMVTEWINFKPRPCIFINAHNTSWEGNENYDMWRYGTVTDDPNNFKNIIKDSLSNNPYHKKQIEHQQRFIHQSDSSSSELCANYILKELEFGH
jgi:CDP-glycerol glycerophosphotransferase (TagB/SpsB family)